MPLTVNALPVAAVVKAATQQLHVETENLLLPRLASIKTPGDYAVVLKMFYGYFAPLETCIRKQLTTAHLHDLDDRRNADFILADLSHLGQAVHNSQHCAHLPEINNIAQAFGAMYVLEGSTLGGKMIAGMLRKNEALAISDEALHFFSGYKEETGRKWTSFLAALNTQTDASQVIAGANNAFLHLKNWMQHYFSHYEH